MGSKFVGAPDNGLDSEEVVRAYVQMHKAVKRTAPPTLIEALDAHVSSTTSRNHPARTLIVRYYGILTVLDDLLENECYDPGVAWKLYKTHVQQVCKAPYLELVHSPAKWPT